MTTMEVGKRLCALVSEGRHLDAIDQFYADDVRSVEAAEMEGGGMPRVMQGKDAVRGKTEWWMNSHDVHKNEVRGPFPHGDDRFAVFYATEATNKESDERFDMQEVAVYTVKDGKITQDEFFYATS